MLLESQNALIYGAGWGIGAVVRTFAREGARVFLAGRTRASLEAVSADIAAAGGSAEVTELDAPRTSTRRVRSSPTAGWMSARSRISGGVLYAPFSDPDGNGWTLQQLPYLGPRRADPGRTGPPSRRGRAPCLPFPQPTVLLLELIDLTGTMKRRGQSETMR